MPRADLVPDCGSCAALCCVATSFDASEDFAFSKPAGVACRYLRPDCRCAIHRELAVRGLPGCAGYDCHGAGQRATKAFAGQREVEAQRNELFLVLRVVHEYLWLLTEAARLCPPWRGELRAEIGAEIAALDVVAQLSAPALLDLELRAHRDATRALLSRVGDALGGRGAEPRF